TVARSNPLAATTRGLALTPLTFTTVGSPTSTSSSSRGLPLASPAVRLLENLRPMIFQIPALFGTERPDVARQADSPVLEHQRIEVLGHPQIALIRKADIP